MDPRTSPLGNVFEHLYRYHFALPYIEGRRVLDVACGEGYGLAALARAGAASAIGVDLDPNVCQHARNTYGVNALCGSAEEIPLPDASVDVVISFETIEHLHNPRLFLLEIRRVLAPGGQCVLSTPNRDLVTTPEFHNPFHHSEMNEQEFTALMRESFARSLFFTQRTVLAPPWHARSLAADRTRPRVRGLNGLLFRVRKEYCRRLEQAKGALARSQPIDFILDPGGGWWDHLLNPYRIRPLLSGREQAIFYLAVVDR